MSLITFERMFVKSKKVFVRKSLYVTLVLMSRKKTRKKEWSRWYGFDYNTEESTSKMGSYNLSLFVYFVVFSCSVYSVSLMMGS